MVEQFEKAAEALKGTVKSTAARTAALMSYTEDNVQALVKAGEIWAAGVQGLSSEIARATRTHFEENIAAAKALSGAKSLQQAIDLQTAFVRTALEKSAAETAKVAGNTKKLAEDAFAPIAARLTASLELPRRAA